MKDLFIPYEEALAMKELGFDDLCIGSSLPDGEVWINEPRITDLIIKEQGNRHAGITEKRPLYQQAFRWFKEKYDTPSFIRTMWQHDWNDYSYQWHVVEKHTEWNSIEHYRVYEQAQLGCLRKLIEIVKKQNNPYDTGETFGEYYNSKQED